MNWIDLTLARSEEELIGLVKSLSHAERKALELEMLSVLKVSVDDIEMSMFRILVERIRPFALPQELWSRPVLDTELSIQGSAREHLERLALEVSNNRLIAMQGLYARYAENRRSLRVTEERLEACGYRCENCGILFYSDVLGKLDIISPHGDGCLPKDDKLKPHWSNEDYRLPTIDHGWPVTSYGSNEDSNLKVFCSGCNAGKANFVTFEHTKPFVGLHERARMLAACPVSTGLFYAQLCRENRCSVSGSGPRDVELTVRLKDDRLPAVLDNLVTVECP